jgi:predicted amidohydrolase YtcJ
MRAIGAIVAMILLFVGATGSCVAQTADTIFVNGKIATVDSQNSIVGALAVADGKILAVGAEQDVRQRTGPATRIIDLAGRTIIPGLTDAHIHGIRAALTYSAEVSWIGVPTLKEALARIGAAADRAEPGAWIIVAGGWIDRQFAEKRKPTQAEVMAVAGGRPVYIQHLYDWVLLTPTAMSAMEIADDKDLPKFGKLLRDASGQPTGEITGNGVTFLTLFNKLPQPTLVQETDSTMAFFRELNRLGLTSIIDPAGVSVGPASYQPLFKLWRDKALTMRVAYYLSSQSPGAELADYQNLLQLLPSGFGDDMLRFAGIGEIVTWAAWTDNEPTADAMDKLEAIIRWAAKNRMGFQIHWNPEKTVDKLFTVLERVNADTPIGDLRWAVDHLYEASDRSLQRMKALGLTWDVQDSLYYSGAQFKKIFGVAVTQRSPPLRTALDMGLRIAAGTDAHRVSDYNPFVSLRWLLTGKTIDGTTTLAETQHPTRAEALRAYTLNGAWLVREDDVRGSLEPGKYADLAVLSADYLTIPEDEIGNIHSMLTMIGGRVVYADGAYAKFADVVANP